MERAENMARLLEVGYWLSLLPHEQGGQADWRSTLRSAGCEAGYLAKSRHLRNARRRRLPAVRQEQPLLGPFAAWRRRGATGGRSAPRSPARCGKASTAPGSSSHERWRARCRPMSCPPCSIGSASARRCSAARCSTPSCATTRSTSPSSARFSSAPTTPRASSTSNTTCCCPRTSWWAAVSTARSGPRSCGRSRPTAATAGSTETPSSPGTSPTS